MKFISPLLSLLLAAGPVFAQSPAPVNAAPLELRVVHRDESKPTADLAVQVTDEAGAPVADATVVFHLLSNGFAGTFADGTSAAAARTDAQGWARVNGVRGYGPAAATASVQATATKGTTHAGVLFTQAFAAQGTAPVPVVAQAPPAAPLRSVAPPAQAVVQDTPELPRMPGVVVEERPRAEHVVPQDDSIDANVPVRSQFGTSASDGSGANVSVVNGGKYAAHDGHSKTKWIIGIAAAAGAGAAFALLHKGGSNGTTPASGISIGAPSISVGHP